MSKLKNLFPSASNIEILGRLTFTLLALPVLGAVAILGFAYGWTVGTMLVVLSLILLGLSVAVLVFAFAGTYLARWRRSRITTGL